MPRRASTCATTIDQYLGAIAYAEQLLAAAGENPGAVDYALTHLEHALSNASERVIRHAHLTGRLAEKRHHIAGRILGVAAHAGQEAA